MSTAPPPKTPPPRSPRPGLTRRPLAPRPAPAPARPPAHVGPAARVKALVDYPAAAALLVLFGPVILAAMALVKLTSRGPAIYTQARVGRGGRVFTIYKIRTMSHDCESLTGPRWALLTGDPRVTPVGRVFRTLHVDELPQLVNVLKGDMALVGPRPERPEICKQLRLVVPGYDKRHQVKPGITGFAQVHLPPDSSLRSVKNKVAYDRFYIQRMGVGADLSVYACTALKLLGLRKLYRRPPRNPAGDE